MNFETKKRKGKKEKILGLKTIGIQEREWKEKYFKVKIVNWIEKKKQKIKYVIHTYISMCILCVCILFFNKLVFYFIDVLQVLMGYKELFKNESFFFFGISYTPYIVATKAKAVEVSFSIPNKIIFILISLGFFSLSIVWIKFDIWNHNKDRFRFHNENRAFCWNIHKLI